MGGGGGGGGGEVDTKSHITRALHQIQGFKGPNKVYHSLCKVLEDLHKAEHFKPLWDLSRSH